MIKLGADPSTLNIDRIMRVPGTVNLPNRAKREDGRVICMAKLLWFEEERRYTLDDFPVPASAPYESQDEGDDEDVPIDRIEAALDDIDPDIDRKPWIAIGCVLFKQLGDEEGFALWNEWSSRGDKYNASEMSGQWKAIKKRGGYAWNIATLFYLAGGGEFD